MSDDAAAKVADGRAWSEFCALLEKAAAVIRRDDLGTTPFDRAEGHRYLSRLLAAGLASFVEATGPAHPEFRALPDQVKMGLDNPDNYYVSASIDPRRDYRIRRDRSAASINLDYRPDAQGAYWLRAFASRFSDTETRQAHHIEFEDAQTPDQAGEAEASRELKSRKETQKIQSFVLGGERLGRLDLEFPGPRQAVIGERAGTQIGGQVGSVVVRESNRQRK